MIELNPKSPGSNDMNDTNGAHGATVTTLRPQIDHTAQHVKDATAEGIDRFMNALSTALTQFDRRTEQSKNLHTNASEQTSGSIRQHLVITINLVFVAGMLLEQLTRSQVLSGHINARCVGRWRYHLWLSFHQTGQPPTSG